MVVHDDLPQSPTANVALPQQWPASTSLHVVGAAQGTALLADGAADSAVRVARTIGAAR
jgi:hypothetical protein